VSASKVLTAKLERAGPGAQEVLINGLIWVRQGGASERLGIRVWAGCSGGGDGDGYGGTNTVVIRYKVLQRDNFG